MAKLFLTVAKCLLVLAPAFSSAAWTGTHEISLLKAQGNGVFIQLSGFTNTDASIDCNGSNTFFLTEGEQNYETKVSFLLSSDMAGKKVQFSYYGAHCIAYVCRLLGIGEFELRRWVDQFSLGTSDRRLSGQKQ